MGESKLQRLVHRVGLRQQVVFLGRWFYRFALGLAIVYALLLIASRLLALIPDRFEPMTLIIIPAAALVLALGIARRPADARCARLIDERSRTKDLFLTAALIDKAPGEYKPLVTAAALAKADEVRPQTVVPFDPWRKTGHVSVALLVLLAGITFLPQLDPFGNEEQRKKQLEREERLHQSRQATAKRAQVLKRKDVKAKNTPQVKAAIEEMKQELRRMKKNDPTGNLRKLQEQRRDLGDMWKRKQQKLADALKQKSTSQRFGSMQTEKTRQWKQQMAAGKTESVQKELKELKKLAREMSQTQDQQKRKELRKKLEDRLNEMKDFAAGEGGSKQLSDALERALQQLDASSMDGMSQEAMEGLAESLNLSQQELEEMAQSLRDLESLEEALKTLQQAKNANNQQPLDGESCGSCSSLSDYAELYRQMTQGGQGEGGLCEGCKSGGSCQGGSCSGSGSGSKPGSGSGGGMGGPGRGRGNIAPEDDTIETDYTAERAKSRLQAGKILMQWKTKEVAETGQVKRDYAKALKDVKQGVMEAIVQEEVPPGYHDAIQDYFDTIPETVDQSKAK